jgi:hypothetical protein
MPLRDWGVELLLEGVSRCLQPSGEIPAPLKSAEEAVAKQMLYLTRKRH